MIVAGLVRQSCFGLLHRVHRPQLLLLQGDLHCPAGARLPHPVGLKTHDHHHTVGTDRVQGLKDKLEQGFAGQRLQHLGQGGFHALALPRRENNDR